MRLNSLSPRTGAVPATNPVRQLGDRVGPEVSRQAVVAAEAMAHLATEPQPVGCPPVGENAAFDRAVDLVEPAQVVVVAASGAPAADQPGRQGLVADQAEAEPVVRRAPGRRRRPSPREADAAARHEMIVVGAHVGGVVAKADAAGAEIPAEDRRRAPTAGALITSALRQGGRRRQYCDGQGRGRGGQANHRVASHELRRDLHHELLPSGCGCYGGAASPLDFPTGVDLAPVVGAQANLRICLCISGRRWSRRLDNLGRQPQPSPIGWGNRRWPVRLVSIFCGPSPSCG